MQSILMSKSVGIFGHYGNLNLGDESIIAAVIENIKLRLPDARLHGFSINPDDTCKRYGIPAYPIRNVARNSTVTHKIKRSPMGQSAKQPSRSAAVDSLGSAAQAKAMFKKIPVVADVMRLGQKVAFSLVKSLPQEMRFLARSYGILKNIDLLIIAGSNQFLDNFGGPFGFPYTLLKWSILARLASTRLVYLSVGAGPLDARLSRLLVRLALMFSDYTSYRDLASKKLIETRAFPKNGKVYPDLAYSLTLPEPANEPRKMDAVADKPVVAINVMPMYDSRYWCVHDDDRYQQYIEKVTAFCAKLFQEKYPVFFFATQKKDENVIEDVLVMLRKENVTQMEAEELVKRSNTVDELMSILASAQIVVATRFHGTVLSLLTEKPVLGICYYRKTDDLLREVELGEYSLSLDTLDPDQLWQTFKKLDKNRTEASERVGKKIASFRRSLDEQYDVVLQKM